MSDPFFGLSRQKSQGREKRGYNLNGFSSFNMRQKPIDRERNNLTSDRGGIGKKGTRSPKALFRDGDESEQAAFARIY